MNDNATIDLRDFFRGTKKPAIIGAIIGLIAGFTWATITPKWYTAVLSVVPSGSSKSAIGLPGGAAALGLVDLPIDLGGGSDVDRIAAIFHSISVTDDVIQKFNLKVRYRAKFLEDARKVFWKNCGTKTDKKSNVLTLSCEDESPATAKAMVAYLADSANQVARRISTSSAGEERRFLETRVAQARMDLDKASRKLREFQEENRVISLPEQAKAIVTSIASLRAELLEKQMQLAYVDGFSSSDESTSGTLRRQVAILQGKLRSLEESRSMPAGNTAVSSVPAQRAQESRGSGGLFPPAMNVPVLQYELEQIMREQKIQETLFGLLTQKYELARVSEARDTSTFQILDSPTLPTKKTGPLRMVITAVGGGLGAFLGVVVAIMMRRRRETVRGQQKKPAATMPDAPLPSTSD